MITLPTTAEAKYYTVVLRHLQGFSFPTPWVLKSVNNQICRALAVFSEVGEADHQNHFFQTFWTIKTEIDVKTFRGWERATPVLQSLGKNITFSLAENQK